VDNDFEEVKYYAIPMYSTSSSKPVFEEIYKKEDLPPKYTQKHNDNGYEYSYSVRPISNPEEIIKIEKQEEEWKIFVKEYNKNAIRKIAEKKEVEKKKVIAEKKEKEDEKKKSKSILIKVWELIWR
jgi:hypothetical protein